MAERSGANPIVWREHGSRSQILAKINPDGSIIVPWGTQSRNNITKKPEEAEDAKTPVKEEPKEKSSQVIYQAAAAD